MKNRTARILSLSVALAALAAWGRASDCSTSSSGVTLLPAFNGIIMQGTPALEGRAALLVYSPSSMPGVPFTGGELCVQPFVPGAGRTSVSMFDAEGNAFPVLPPSGTFYQGWHRTVDGTGDTTEMRFMP